MAARLTRHATERIAQRTKLEPAEVKRLIDERRTWPVKGRPHNPATQQVFYSEPDQNWYIAMQDPANETVITVVAYATSGLTLSARQLLRLKDLALGKRAA